jgi:hypothetical protein
MRRFGNRGKRRRLRTKMQSLSALSKLAAAIAAVAQKCLDAKGVDCGARENEIDPSTGSGQAFRPHSGQALRQAQGRRARGGVVWVVKTWKTAAVMAIPGS